MENSPSRSDVFEQRLTPGRVAVTIEEDLVGRDRAYSLRTELVHNSALSALERCVSIVKSGGNTRTITATGHYVIHSSSIISDGTKSAELNPISNRRGVSYVKSKSTLASAVGLAVFSAGDDCHEELVISEDFCHGCFILGLTLYN
ncbi:MAG: hypothetical protein ACREYC_15635 [Gammaproteobacteria bacterium]